MPHVVPSVDEVQVLVLAPGLQLWQGLFGFVALEAYVEPPMKHPPVQAPPEQIPDVHAVPSPRPVQESVLVAG
jgi:hypothetical protein